jgi:hypothetical protein
MIPLTVHHRTAYRYRRPVSLWTHRLMLCPRESRDLQVISCVVTVSPTAQVTWADDVFGNAVATAVFAGASDSLVIESALELQLEGSAWPIFNISASRKSKTLLLDDHKSRELATRCAVDSFRSGKERSRLVHRDIRSGCLRTCIDHGSSYSRRRLSFRPRTIQNTTTGLNYT